MRIVAVCNQKGGVGKTTTAVNLGAALARLGQKVLLADIDPQRNLSDTLGFVQDNTPTTTNELIYFTAYNMPINLSSFIRHNEKEQVDFIPASPALSSAPTILANVADGNRVLAKALSAVGSQCDYDVCIIDCKGSLDLLTSNALTAADSIIIPVEAEEYAVNGLADLLSTIDSIQKSLNPKLTIDGILINRADTRRSNVKTTRDDLTEALGDGVVLETMIPYLKEVSDAPTEHRTCVTKKGSRVGELYMDVAKEVISKWQIR